MNAWTICLLMLAGGAQGGGSGHDHDRGHGPRSDHRFENPEEWMERFESPERDAWQRPDEVVGFLRLEPGDAVADVGAGTGYFALRLAKAVGREGRVYAIDVETSMVEFLSERAEKEGLPQIEAVLAPYDDPSLEPSSVDAVLIVNTWHHVGDRVEYAKKLVAALRPGGRILMVDYRKEELPVGPPVEHKISRQELIAELAKAGLGPVEEWTDLEYQYAIAFAPQHPRE